MAAKKKTAKKISLYEKINKILPFELKDTFEKLSSDGRKGFSTVANGLLEYNIQIVYVTYELEQINNCTFENGVIYFGNTEVDLATDRDPENPKIFRTKGDKDYSCIAINGSLKITVRANGNMGDGWKLAVKVNSKSLADNPIEKNVGNNGRADHLKYHPLP